MKLRTYIAALILLLSSVCLENSATAKIALSRQQQEARVMEIRTRVEQIKGMDIPALGTTQRAELKKELKGMNKELHAMRPVVLVMSLGALIVIIIILLLIL
jgi:uncharacterized membrane protein YidH (DUF202 family)